MPTAADTIIDILFARRLFFDIIRCHHQIFSPLHHPSPMAHADAIDISAADV